MSTDDMRHPWRDDERLPRLERALKSPGISVTACLQLGGPRNEPLQTVVLKVHPGASMPAYVPQEALDRARDDFYIDEYGTAWKGDRTGDGGWYIIRHIYQNAPTIPNRARHWPLKWCEMEVARLLKRLGQHSAHNTREDTR